jgi:hypothetical protein
MRPYLVLMWFAVATLPALAQDPAAMATQIANQTAVQQANDQMMQASQTANQQAAQAAQSASSSLSYGRCVVAAPRLSEVAGRYGAPISVKIKDNARGAEIYYTTDGWTPTAASTRYLGPIAIDHSTKLQAIAVTASGCRSRLATADYILPTAAAAGTAVAPAAGAPANDAGTDGKILLARGTAVPFLFDAGVSSKSAEIGDKIPLTLAEDLRVGNVVVAKKGTPSTALITGVDQKGFDGLPGEVFFQVDALDVSGTVVKLRGSAAKEGQSRVPGGIFVRGKDAEIQRGAEFRATVDADTILPPAN